MQRLFKPKSTLRILMMLFVSVFGLSACAPEVAEKKAVEPEPEGITRKWGYINKNGRFVIPLQYDGADTFSEGRARVSRNKDIGKTEYSFIDTHGKVIFTVDEECDALFRDGMLAFSYGGKWGFKDLDGKTVVEPTFDAVDHFSEGLAPVCRGKWGFIDKKGEYIIKPEYRSAKRFHQGIGFVRTRDKGWCGINTKGKILFGGYNGVGTFHDGLARAKNQRIGFVDTRGKLVVPQVYKDSHDFSQGRAAVCDKDRKWGFIDTTGKVVVPLKFHDAGTFSGGYCFVIQQDGMAGYVGLNGKDLLLGKIHDGGPFAEGLAPVSIKEKWGFVDTTGNFVVKPKYDFVGAFGDGLAPVAM